MMEMRRAGFAAIILILATLPAWAEPVSDSDVTSIMGTINRQARGIESAPGECAESVQYGETPAADSVEATSWRRPQRAVLSVQAYPWYHGGDRWYVSETRVSEHGDYSHRWTRHWAEVGNASAGMSCQGAVRGRNYAILIRWKNPRTGAVRSSLHHRQLDSLHQTERFYSP